MKRQQFLAIKWLIHAARDRSGNGMPKKLAAEFLDAFNNEVCTVVTVTNVSITAFDNMTVEFSY